MMHETATPTSPLKWIKPWLSAVLQVLKIKVQVIIDLCTSNFKKYSREGCSYRDSGFRGKGPEWQLILGSLRLLYIMS